MLHIAGWTIKETSKKKWFNEGEQDFLNCPNLEPWMRCSYSSNRNAVNYSKALLFHGRYIELDDMPTERPSRQKWIFYENEPPPIVSKRVDLSQYKDIFNVTSTYTMDSNIPLLFRRFECIPKQDPVSERTNYAHGKSGQAVWFVSDCKTQSRREFYAVELAKYLQVDTFGKCGTARCPITDTDNGEKCIEKLITSTYKFYLAFEDSFCDAYITEQFGRLLNLNIIPVVMGSVEVGSILPPGSYIDVRDFESPKELAGYLKRIDADDELYNKYIIAKNQVKCRHPFAFKFSCQLCYYLHANRYKREQVFDVSKFWSEESRCTAANNFYRGVADTIVSSEPGAAKKKRGPMLDEEEERAPRSSKRARLVEEVEDEEGAGRAARHEEEPAAEEEEAPPRRGPILDDDEVEETPARGVEEEEEPEAPRARSAVKTRRRRPIPIRN
jgi:hypothetical protein